VSRAILLLPALFLVAVLVVEVLGLRGSVPMRSDDLFRIDPAGGELLGTWMDVSAGGMRFDGGEIRESVGRFRYVSDSDKPLATVVVEVHHRDTVARPARRTGQFALQVAQGPAPAALLDAIETRLAHGEHAFRWIERGPSGSARGSWLDRAAAPKLHVAWLLLAQAPLWLALAYAHAARELRRMTPLARGLVIAAMAAAAVARWVLAPLRLVTLYTGYQLTSEAIALQPVPRYGAGAPVFHHLLMRLFGEDHRVVLWAHSVLGVAIVPLLAAFALRMQGRQRVAVIAAFSWALVPAFVAHDNSEANTVPAVLCMLGGLVLLGGGVAERRPGALTGATALLAFAMMCRPELPIVVPAAALVTVVAARDASTKGADLLSDAWPLAVATVAVLVPHVAHVLASAQLLQVEASLPSAPQSGAPIDVAVLAPRLFPFAWVPLAVVALASSEGPDRPPSRRMRDGMLLAVAALDFVVTRLDLDRANILRVQVPGALFFALVASSGLDLVLDRLARWSAGLRWRRPLAGGLVAATAASALPSLPAAFARTNEDEEESFVRLARSTLHGEPLLVRLGYGDVERSSGTLSTHLYFPDYLFSPSSGPRRVRDIVEWERGAEPGPAYFYLGVRCYAREREGVALDGATGETLPMRRACRDFRDRWGDGVVLERDVPNHGDPLATGYYDPDTSRPMHLALVRLKAR
jgi:hypothetical protein